MKNIITIRGPKAIIKAWIDALRSGKYAQGHGALKDQFKNGYCCLGVLQMAVDGKVEMVNDDGTGIGYSRTSPSKEWLESKGITFSAAIHDDFGGVRKVGVVNPGFPSRRNKFNTGELCAIGANDSSELTFAQIADLVEKHSEY